MTGPNSPGKTTLLALATGAKSSRTGPLSPAASPPKVLDQRVSLLADDETLVENFRRLNPGGHRQ